MSVQRSDRRPFPELAEERFHDTVCSFLFDQILADMHSDMEATR